MDSTMKEYARNLPIDFHTPLRPFDWTQLIIREAKEFMGENFQQFIMLLAGGISAFHYDKVIKIVGEYHVLSGGHI